MKLLTSLSMVDDFIERALKRRNIVMDMSRVSPAQVRKLDKEKPFKIYAEDCDGDSRMFGYPNSVKELEDEILKREVEWHPRTPKLNFGEEFICFASELPSLPLYKITVYVNWEDLLAPNKPTKRKRYPRR